MPPKPRFRSRSLRLASRRSRMSAISSAIALVDEDQSKVAMVAQFAPAELAEPEQDVTARPGGAFALGEVRHAEALQQGRVLQGGDPSEDGFGEVAERRGGGADGVLVE